jgi:hypothetical protein
LLFEDTKAIYEELSGTRADVVFHEEKFREKSLGTVDPRFNS